MGFGNKHIFAYNYIHTINILTVLYVSALDMKIQAMNIPFPKCLYMQRQRVLYVTPHSWSLAYSVSIFTTKILIKNIYVHDTNKVKLTYCFVLEITTITDSMEALSKIPMSFLDVYCNILRMSKYRYSVYNTLENSEYYIHLFWIIKLVGKHNRNCEEPFVYL